MKDMKDDFLSRSGEFNIIPVMQVDANKPKVDTKSLPEIIPILALRNAVIFPGTVFPTIIGREKSVRLIEDIEKSNGFFGTVPQVDVSVEDPTMSDLSPYGTLAKVIKTIEMPDGSITAILQGYTRFELKMLVNEEPYLVGRVEYLTDIIEEEIDNNTKAIGQTLKEKAKTAIKMSNQGSKEAAEAINSIDNFEFLVNFIATTIEIENFEEKIELLRYADLKERAMKLLVIINKQIELLKIKMDINLKVKSDIDQQQREYFLNNQLKTIQEELGMDDSEEITALRTKAMHKKWSSEIHKIFNKELIKLERFNTNSPDYSTQYNYINFLLDLPWDHISKDKLNLNTAQKQLDKDHFGLESVKERIIEYLAVLKLRNDMKSPILCLYGPPGVGKTSLGKSVAKALGREYVRISLGGVHDESEIRGHRKTYVGALPGRIMNAINRAGTSNPVIVLDEIDKISKTVKGDPSSALLEVLDPEQNTTFHDNYLDLDYDLSKVLFLTTANDISTIQPALKDRMEMINVSGYLTEEKIEIAKNHLLPKQISDHGLKKSDLNINKETIKAIITEYTSESGVRGLEKQLAKIARVTAKKVVLKQDRPSTFNKSDLKEYLGLPISSHDDQKGNEAVGVVTGLAWTRVGGEILFVESSISEGKGLLSTTGNLGDVMKESATIAYQYIKAHPELANITYEEFSKKDIHIHVPEGAVPKDGPSAGITIVSSMVSALRKTKIKSKIAMTGEMTLRGKVLPVGGIKEKILAAKRAGIKTIIISEKNRKDIEDIKEVYIKGLDFIYVQTIDDVISNIFPAK